ncbi:radical SAM protein [Myroides sp. TSA_177.3]|uniref:radical SAM protein n=1 Tax=Myroides sp. TSA_177.3 TaxID=3415650 RepID=UPI0040467FA9
MKTSFYNHFFENEGKVIGYNAITDHFLILEPILYDLFIAGWSEGKIHELKLIHEDFYNILISRGFLIEDYVDELENIIAISDKTDSDYSLFEMTINPTMNCNFKCWYCYETHIKKSKMDEVTIQRVISLVDEVLLKKSTTLKTFHLQWFGGEPLLYFEKTVLPLLEEIYPKFYKTGIQFISGFTTNGLLINQKMLDQCKRLGVKTFQITLDGYRDRHNQVRFVSKTKGSYDEIVANIKLCLQNRFYVVARINISAETISDLEKILDDFADIDNVMKEYLNFSFHEVWQEEKDLAVDISHIVELFRDANFKSSYLAESNASIYNSCYADKPNHVTINYNGDLYKCTARDYLTENREGVLESSGSLVWNEKFYKRTIETRFKNKPCLECNILPICNGGCSQHRLENENNDYCIHDFDYEKKMRIVKEKFSSRLHYNNLHATNNQFFQAIIKIDFDKIKRDEPIIFQQSLKEFFEAELSSDKLDPYLETNSLFSKAVYQLRRGDLSFFLKQESFVLNKLNQLGWDIGGKNVFNLYYLPAKAYYFYKIRRFEEAIDFTHQSILSDDVFLDRHLFLYGHKIQQIHNLIRINFRMGLYEEACKLTNDVLNHLVFGYHFEYEVGCWKESYNLLEDLEMLGMVYQVFTETVRTIVEVSFSKYDEKTLFEIAFKDLLSAENGSKIKEISYLLTFLDFKSKIFGNIFIAEDILEKWLDTGLKSEYGYEYKSLLFSLYTSLGINSYEDNKTHFKQLYSK